MEAFAIAPVQTKAFWIVGLIPLVVLVIVVTVLVMTMGGIRAGRFEVSSEGLRLRGDWYGRLIPADHLVRGSARRVDFTQTPDLTPTRRTFGTGLPGYQAGWFRLRNGDSALLYLTDRSKAVYVSTTEGYGVLLSPSEPEKFLTALDAVTK